MSMLASPHSANGYPSHRSFIDRHAQLVKGPAHIINRRRSTINQNMQSNGDPYMKWDRDTIKWEETTCPRSCNGFETPALVHPRFTSVIFDLGDVLFTWSAFSPNSPLPPKTLKNILRSSIWFDYEKGNLTEDQAYTKVAYEFDLSACDVADAFRSARDSLRSNPALLNVIREMKESGRSIFAMSNISAPDWDVLMTKADPSEWALFDRVFTSAAAHERKPNVGFYRHVLEETGVEPTRTIFVDDKIENVLTARSFGMHGIVFDELPEVLRQLKNLCGNPVQRAKSFLTANKRKLVSVTSTGVVLQENFAQLLILEATGDRSIFFPWMQGIPAANSSVFRSLVDYVEHARLFNFFQSTGVLTTEQFPNDLDTTSVGLTVSNHTDIETKHNVMDEMLTFRNEDGLVQVYFDHSRPRIDPVVCANVLTFFCRNGRGHELESTLKWVYFCLLHRAYIDGTLYYATAETFLFFVSRLMQSSLHVRQRFEPVFKARVMERFSVEGDSLALAMRVLAAASVDLADRPDIEKLLSMQEENGSWTNGWFYKYGSSGVLIRNDGLTTALAIEAIHAAHKLGSDECNKSDNHPQCSSNGLQA